MIVRSMADVQGTPRDASGPGWHSARLVVKGDGVGYSLHETTVVEGAELHLQYKHHYESNYCFAGEGEVEDVVTGEVHRITPGTVYVLDKNDRHILRATKGDLKLVCVFNPPLVGDETHAADGSYQLG